MAGCRIGVGSGILESMNRNYNTPGAHPLRRRHLVAGVVALLLPAALSAVGPPATTPGSAPPAAQVDAFEVTVRQVAAFLNEVGNPVVKGVPLVTVSSAWAGIVEQDGRFVPREGRAAYPAVEVSFEGARAYCEWAGKRLPTEAEWQSACEGPAGRAFPWGETLSDTTGVPRANIEGTTDGFARTAPVGSFSHGRTVDGHWDMSGNVWEWTVGPEGQPMLRGGSWATGDQLARCAHRDDPSSSHSYYKGSSVGFRCVR